MTQTFEIVRLCFDGPLHLARGKSDYASSSEILHSDALKSALFAAAQSAGLDVAAQQVSANSDFQNEFLDSFDVSSAFPFYADEYFFPKPKCEIHEVWDGTEKDRKGGKKISFIGKRFFEEVLKGSHQFSEKIDANRHVFGKFASERIALFRQEDKDFFIVSENNVMLRVVVPRHYETEDQNPQPYYVERMFFHENAGLYFFFKFSNDQFRSTFEAALNLLGESGIGTDRNVGNGQFIPKFSTLTLDLPDNPTHQLLLSLCCPSKSEADTITNAATAAYSLIKRGGYISSPEQNESAMAYRKRSIYMLEEGSVLPAGNIKGVLHDLRPDIYKSHPIWRDGRAFVLPINPYWND